MVFGKTSKTSNTNEGLSLLRKRDKKLTLSMKKKKEKQLNHAARAKPAKGLTSLTRNQFLSHVFSIFSAKSVFFRLGLKNTKLTLSSHRGINQIIFHRNDKNPESDDQDKSMSNPTCYDTFIKNIIQLGDVSAPLLQIAKPR